MNKLINRFGKLITASFFVMGAGVLLFLLTPVLLTYFNFDSDLPGLMLAATGLFIFTIGYILREKLHKELDKVKLSLLIVAAVILGMPILFFMGSLIYFLITRQPLGE